MSVKKYKIRTGNFDKDNNIKIPIELDFNSVDQSEVVNRDFISIEVEKSINPILDYDKVRFTPIKMDGDLVKDLIIKMNFLSEDGSYMTPTYYSDLGFSDDDIRFKKNKFLNSFLKFSFYDSDVTTNQNLISITTIYSKVTLVDTVDLFDSSGDPITGGGLPLNANEFQVRHILNNPITQPQGFAEGFYIYHFRSDLEASNPTELYMRAEFNNAANGKTTKFIATDELLDINYLIGKLHIKYLLTRDATGYYYTLDTSYNDSTNITESGTGVILDLYEIRVE
jgi:hypothetical protein